jgi:pimeloyl-ACP methyl ester carboxylesterase
MFRSRLCVPIFISVLSVFIVAGSAPGGEIYPDVPDQADPARKYIVFLHGAWIELQGLKEKNPRHGRYQFTEIVSALADKGFAVISEARLQWVEPEEYAEKVAGQVRRLIEMGVPAENVTVVGHSKGGKITLIAAGKVRNDGVNYVVLAGCGKTGTASEKGFRTFVQNDAAKMQGRILSIYDTSDQVAGSCREAFDAATGLRNHEITLETGKGHGLFYTPTPEWIDEVVRWANHDLEPPR